MPGSGARAFPVRQTSCRLGSESVVALMRIGAYMVATTLTVVSCLHRHASLDSMREVETVQPLAPLPISGKTINHTAKLTSGHRYFFRPGPRSGHGRPKAQSPRSWR